VSGDSYYDLPWNAGEPLEAILQGDPEPEPPAPPTAEAEPDDAPDGPPRTLPPPGAPMDVARELVAEKYTSPSSAVTLRHWRGGWWQWHGPRWLETEQRAVRAAAYAYTETAVFQASDKTQPWAPNRKKIADLLEALAAIVLLPETVAMPTWLDGRGYTGLIVSAANGLLDVAHRELIPHDPAFFNATSVPFEYDTDALDPERWDGFLADLWGDDEASKDALGEWFGYVISGRLDLHKILLIVGPTRAGKGVIARTLGRLVGRENVAGPTLASLSGDFGLAPLLGKTLAVVSDARLNGRGAHVVVERLLSISGEDTLTVNRKYRDQWTGKLPARLMLCSNELPQLGDASMAVAGRFVPLLLTESWYGREDLQLEISLEAELPGVLNWALEGLARLSRRQQFTRPPNIDDTIRTLQDLASPAGAFVRDCCETGPGKSVQIDELYRAYRWWGEANGHPRISKQVFGRDLRAVLGGRLKVTQPRATENRARVYEGIDLTKDARAGMAVHEAERSKR
jgi:putative DNA primase/helicase